MCLKTKLKIVSMVFRDFVNSEGLSTGDEFNVLIYEAVDEGV